jgi:hypothetical protein
MLERFLAGAARVGRAGSDAAGGAAPAGEGLCKGENPGGEASSWTCYSCRSSGKNMFILNFN